MRVRIADGTVQIGPAGGPWRVYDRVGRARLGEREIEGGVRAMVTATPTPRATGATGGEVRCPACPGVTLGRWAAEHGRPVFRPNLHSTRSIECGDGWLAVRCKVCGTRTEILHGVPN